MTKTWKDHTTIEDFNFPVDLKAEFRQNTIPFMAQQVAKVHKGKFAGSEVLMGMGGPMISVKLDGEFLGHVGMTYSELSNGLLIPFLDRLDFYKK